MSNEKTLEQYKQLKQKMENIQHEKNVMDIWFKSKLPEYINLLREYEKIASDDDGIIYLESIDTDTRAPEKFDKVKNSIEITKYDENAIDFRINYYMGCNEWSWETYTAPLAFFFDDEYKKKFHKEIKNEKERCREKEQKENEIERKMAKERKYQKYLDLKGQFEGTENEDEQSVLPKEKTKAAIHQFKSTARMFKLQKESEEHHNVPNLKFEHFLFLHFLKGTDYTRTVPSKDSEALSEEISNLRASCHIYETRIKHNSDKNLTSINAIKRIQNVFTVLTADEIVAVIRSVIRR